MSFRLIIRLMELSAGEVVWARVKRGEFVVKTEVILLKRTGKTTWTVLLPWGQSPGGEGPLLDFTVVSMDVRYLKAPGPTRPPDLIRCRRRPNPDERRVLEELETREVDSEPFEDGSVNTNVAEAGSRRRGQAPTRKPTLEFEASTLPRLSEPEEQESAEQRMARVEHRRMVANRMTPFEVEASSLPSLMEPEVQESHVPLCLASLFSHIEQVEGGRKP